MHKAEEHTEFLIKQHVLQHEAEQKKEAAEKALQKGKGSTQPQQAERKTVISQRP